MTEWADPESPNIPNDVLAEQPSAALSRVIRFRETSNEGMIMPPKIRNLALRPRSGASALTVLIALSIPATASAAVPDVPQANTQARTYVNLARAFSWTDERNDYSVKFQLRQSSASTLNVANHAVASTSGCRDCGAFAIAFQVVVAAKQDLVTLNANNTADATSYACIRCSTLAAAYQIIYASDSQQRLTFEQRRGLAQVREQLLDLQYSGLDPDQIQSRADALANQAVSILRDSPGPAPAFSPAIHALPVQMTENSGPVVDRFREVQNRDG
jgi:hypothetical protein